jgi:hypothetical protein
MSPGDEILRRESEGTDEEETQKKKEEKGLQDAEPDRSSSSENQTIPDEENPKVDSEGTDEAEVLEEEGDEEE